MIRMEKIANCAIDELCDIIGEEETVIRFIAKGCSYEDLQLFFAITEEEFKELKKITEEGEKEWR